MARFVHSEHSTKVWLSANDTYEWANKRTAFWPCSELSGHRLFAEFASNGDLIDLTIDGKSEDVDVNEFNAITSDFLREKYGEHPAIR